MASGIPAVMTLPCSSPPARNARRLPFTPFHQGEYIKLQRNCKAFFGAGAAFFVGLAPQGWGAKGFYSITQWAADLPVSSWVRGSGWPKEA